MPVDSGQMIQVMNHNELHRPACTANGSIEMHGGRWLAFSCVADATGLHGPHGAKHQAKERKSLSSDAFYLPTVHQLVNCPKPKSRPKERKENKRKAIKQWKDCSAPGPYIRRQTYGATMVMVKYRKSMVVAFELNK